MSHTSELHSEVRWADEEQTLIHQIFYPHWGRDDVIHVVTTTKSMAESVDHKIHILMDFSRAKLDTPAKLSSLASPIENSVPENQHYLCIVGANRYIELLMKYASLLAPKASKNRHFFECTECAVDFLRDEGLDLTLLQAVNE